MTDYPFQIAVLIQKSMVGVLNDEERKQLEQWLAENDEHERMYQELVRPGFLEEARREHHQFQVGEGYRRFVAGKRKTDRLRIGKRWTAVAAMGALVIGVALAFLFHMGDRMEQESQLPVAGVIKPGKAGALLTLSDGRQVVLSDSLETRLKEQTADIRVQGKRLDYSSEHIDSLLVYNTITVPRGGEYQLTLSDGTQVWLNAGTELKYPVAFTDKVREVFLKGEAYFEVTSDVKHPFVVVTREANIKVLGTSFNVSNYEEDGRMEVALVSGKVDFMAASADEAYTLTPGEVIRMDKETSFVWKSKEDVSMIGAWRNGYFYFENIPMEELAVKLERWYQVKFTFGNEEVRQMRFTGTIKRDQTLDYVLKIIENTKDISFVNFGDRIGVYQK